MIDLLKSELKVIPGYHLVGDQPVDKCKIDLYMTPSTATIVLKQAVNRAVNANVSIPVAVVPFAPAVTTVFTSVRTQTVTMVADDLSPPAREQFEQIQANTLISRNIKEKAIAIDVSEPEPHLKDLIHNFMIGVAQANHSKPCIRFKEGEKGKGSLKVQIDFQVTQKIDGSISLVYTCAKFGGGVTATDDYTNSIILEMKLEGQAAYY